MKNECRLLPALMTYKGWYASAQRKILFAIGKRCLTIRAEVFVLGIAVRKHITLNDMGIAATCGFATSCASDIGFRDGSSSGSKNIFLHDRHLSFYAIAEIPKTRNVEKGPSTRPDFLIMARMKRNFKCSWNSVVQA